MSSNHFTLILGDTGLQIFAIFFNNVLGIQVKGVSSVGGGFQFRSFPWAARSRVVGTNVAEKFHVGGSWFVLFGLILCMFCEVIEMDLFCSIDRYNGWLCTPWIVTLFCSATLRCMAVIGFVVVM